jgi:hypothetical protein
MFYLNCQVKTSIRKLLRSLIDEIMIAEIGTAEINGMSKWGQRLESFSDGCEKKFLLDSAD